MLRYVRLLCPLEGCCCAADVHDENVVVFIRRDLYFIYSMHCDHSLIHHKRNCFILSTCALFVTFSQPTTFPRSTSKARDLSTLLEPSQEKLLSFAGRCENGMEQNELNVMYTVSYITLFCTNYLYFGLVYNIVDL